MSRVFAVIPAKSTFGTLHEVIYQSDYLEIKKARAVCKGVKPRPRTIPKPKFPNISNKTNLVIGQYSKMNLNGIITVSSNIEDINVVIDPIGELFGNTPCGELNYTKYLQLYVPSENYKTFAHYKRNFVMEPQNSCENNEDEILNSIYSEISNINTRLTDTLLNVSDFKNDIIETKTAISQTNTALAVTQQDVSTAKTAISQTNTALVATQQDMITTKTAISQTNTALVATQQDMITTKTSISQTNTALAVTQQDVSTAKSDIIATKTSISQTNTALAATQQDVSTAKSDIIATNTAISQTNTALAATQQDMSTAKSDIIETNTALAETQQDVSDIVSAGVINDVQKQHIDWIYMQIFNDTPNNIMVKYPDVPYRG